MCVTSLLCGPLAVFWPFYGFLCTRFSLYIKGRKSAATFPVRSHRQRLGVNSALPLPLTDSNTAWDSDYSHSGWETVSCSRCFPIVSTGAKDWVGCRDLRPLIRSRCKGVLKRDNEWKEELSCVTWAEFGGDWSSWSKFPAVFLRWISRAASLECPTLVNLYIMRKPFR